jgi:hypothetical protein
LIAKIKKELKAIETDEIQKQEVHIIGRKATKVGVDFFFITEFVKN